jgi:hypothetical protein
MYQNIILLSEKNFGEADFGGKQWRQLVIGVVLIVGYSKSWSYLAKHPVWADHLISGLSDADIRAKIAEELRAAYKDLQANQDFVHLLAKTELEEEQEGKAVETRITSDVVIWLSQIIPVSFG